jgi:hypothetical protein
MTTTTLCRLLARGAPNRAGPMPHDRVFAETEPAVQRPTADAVQRHEVTRGVEVPREPVRAGGGRRY